MSSTDKTPPTPTPTPPPAKKKMCCACPDTKKLRDDCIVAQGEDKCADLIEMHKKCLRSEGFDV